VIAETTAACESFLLEAEQQQADTATNRRQDCCSR
jgi:hypothetical protein